MPSVGVPVFGIASMLAGAAFAADCPLTPTVTERVAAVLSGDSIVLESGMPVRLATVAAPDGGAAEATLAGLVGGRVVEVRLASSERDRYGRAVAQVFIPGQPDLWLQAALVERGLLEVRTTAENASCARALLAIEAMAREARAGIWADAAFASLAAADPTLTEHVGSYAAVEGRVVSTGGTERTLFLNFGYDWSTDFTVTMSASDAAGFDFSGVGVEGLAGRLVRVRGWIQERDGATIRIDHAEQIEILDGGV